MTKKEFIDLGLSDELAVKAEEASKKELEGFIPKSRFDEVNNAKKAAEKDLKERDMQLEELKKNSGDSEELKKKIEELQKENKESAEKAASELKDIKLTSAIKVAVAGKVHDEDMVAMLIDKSKLILGDDGKVSGLDEQLNVLQESKKFLFKTGLKKTGYTPAGGEPPVSNPFSKESFNLTEQGKLMRENPALAKELASAAGVNL